MAKTVTKKRRQEVWEKYNQHCAYCGKEIEYKDMQVDHIKPKKWSPEPDNSLENLNPSCRRCNHYKRARSLKRFRELLLTLHERIQEQYISKVGLDYSVLDITPWDGKFYYEKFNTDMKNTDQERIIVSLTEEELYDFDITDETVWHLRGETYNYVETIRTDQFSDGESWDTVVQRESDGLFFKWRCWDSSHGYIMEHGDNCMKQVFPKIIEKTVYE